MMEMSRFTSIHIIVILSIKPRYLVLVFGWAITHQGNTLQDIGDIDNGEMSSMMVFFNARDLLLVYTCIHHYIHNCQKTDLIGLLMNEESVNLTNKPTLCTTISIPSK